MATYLVYQYGESVYLVRRFFDESDTFGGRSEFLADALQVIEKSTVDQVIFGFGVNGVRDILKWDNSPHSGMIRIWLEHGLLTIAMYFLLNVIMLRKLSIGLRRRDSLDAERQATFLMLLTFFVAEAMVIQMFGVDLFYALFLAVFSFYLALRKIELLGAPTDDEGDGPSVSWRVEGNKTIVWAPQHMWAAVRHAWAFKLTYANAL